jgi:hypothetical protein
MGMLSQGLQIPAKHSLQPVADCLQKPGTRAHIDDSVILRLEPAFRWLPHISRGKLKLFPIAGCGAKSGERLAAFAAI